MNTHELTTTGNELTVAEWKAFEKALDWALPRLVNDDLNAYRTQRGWTDPLTCTQWIRGYDGDDEGYRYSYNDCGEAAVIQCENGNWCAKCLRDNFETVEAVRDIVEDRRLEAHYQYAAATGKAKYADCDCVHCEWGRKTWTERRWERRMEWRKTALDVSEKCDDTFTLVCGNIFCGQVWTACECPDGGFCG